MSLDNLTSCAAVDLDAIEHNLRAIQAHVGPGVRLCAVVKANAYGHGVLPVARAALDAGAQWLAVARVDEGIQLRQAGITQPVLVIGYAVPGEAAALVQYRLTPTVNRIEVAWALSQQAQGHPVTVHVKVDTGIGRYGLLPDEVLPFLSHLRALPDLHLEGMYTHFATADAADQTYMRQQLATYQEVLAAVREAGYAVPIRHAANSAAALSLPDSYLDMVRIGIAMYGLAPSDEVPSPVTLRPALSLISHVARVRTLPAGSSIGYGRTYICAEPTRVALVPLGYGDGYRRALSNRGQVLIGGQRAAIIGRVSMDQITVDVTHIPGVQEDDEVVLIGAQGDAAITADEIARLTGTINYEVTTALLPRLPRVFKRQGEAVAAARLIPPDSTAS